MLSRLHTFSVFFTHGESELVYAILFHVTKQAFSNFYV